MTKQINGVSASYQPRRGTFGSYKICEVVVKLSLPKISRGSIRTGFNQGAGLVKGFGQSAASKLHIAQVTRKDKVFSAGSYLFLGGLVVRLFKKEPNEFLKFHIRQSIVLFVLFALLVLIPEYGVTIFAPILLLLMLVNLVISALGGTLKLIPR